MLTRKLHFADALSCCCSSANLASFLVVRNTPAIQINTLNDAVKNNYRICVLKGSTLDEHLNRLYQRARVVRVAPPEQEVYTQLRDGKCDITITSVSSWNEFQMDASVNGDCRLTWIGRTIQNDQGGFATKSDSGSLCTSLIRDVLNLHMLEMKSDGFIDRAWDDHLKKRATVDCDAATATADTADDDDNGSTAQLTLQAMGGAFIVHYIATAFAIFLAVFLKVRSKKSLMICKKMASGESEPASMSRNQGLEARESWQNSVVEDENSDPALPHANGLSLQNNNDDSESFPQSQVQEMNAKLAALAQQNEQLSLQNAAIIERLNALVST
jgi:hypothetical protein